MRINSPCLLLVSWAATLEKVLPSRKLTLEELKKQGAKWITEFSKDPPNHDDKRVMATDSEAVPELGDWGRGGDGAVTFLHV